MFETRLNLDTFFSLIPIKQRVGKLLSFLSFIFHFIFLSFREKPKPMFYLHSSIIYIENTNLTIDFRFFKT